MSDEREATPAATLEEYITNPCIPKNENEWWASREITRLRERLAEADECNRRVSDENQRIRQAIKEYLSNLARVTNDMLRETWERESGDD